MRSWSLATLVGLAIISASVAPALAQDPGSDDLDFLSLPAETATAEPAPAAPVAPQEPATAPAPQPAEAAPPTPEVPLAVIPVPQKAAATPEMQQPRTRRRKEVIEEVVVTAQRREESAQDVPISITVFSQEQLSDANITNSSDLATYTPSLSSNTRFGNENASFSIRGFTQDLRTTASVGTYFAEVVAPRGQSSQTSGDGAGPGALFDLQNVQVLKGPQGTLFGRNTTGGAVLIVPRKPGDEFEGYVEFSGGDYELLRGQAVVNVPISERFRIRAGIDMNQREGHLNNVSRIGADTLGNVDYAAYRLSAVLDITDSLENYTILSYVDSETHGYSARLFACNGNPNPLTNTFFAFTGPPCLAQLRRQAESGQDGFYDTVSTVATPITAIVEKRLINTTTWEATENVTLKNILAYSHLKGQNGSSIFGTQFIETAAALLGFGLPGGLVDPRREFSVGASVKNPNFPVVSQETFVEEIQLQGNAFDGRLIWQTGLYYENSRPDGYSGNNSAGLLSCELSTIEGDPSGYNCFDPLGGVIGSVLVQEYKTEYLNKAAYFQATLNITDQIGMTAGLRYTWDDTKGYGIKTRHPFLLNLPLPPTVAISQPEVSSQAPTGLIEFDYKPIEGVMAYAKYIRGYRQGSVNLAADPGVDSHDPEKVDTYEVGAKTGFGGPVPGRLNLAVFYNDFTDMQLQAGYVSPSSGGTTAIFNAGKAEIKGLEAELYLQLLDDLSLAVAYSYLETKLIETGDNRAAVRAAGGVIAGLTYTPIADVGDTLPFAPDHTYVASLNYRLPLSPEIGEIELGATYVYTGEQRAAGSSTTPWSVLDSRTLLNLNLNWTRIMDLPVDLAVFGTNVLDEEYVTYVSGTYNALGLESRQMGLPRMIGARLKYNFGAYAD